jgi:hypothetical protein
MPLLFGFSALYISEPCSEVASAIDHQTAALIAGASRAEGLNAIDAPNIPGGVFAILREAGSAVDSARARTHTGRGVHFQERDDTAFDAEAVRSTREPR